MKKSRYLIVGVLFLFVQDSYSSNPDEWSGRSERILWSNWSVNLNLGFTSYFGDLSQYDMELLNKLRFESKPAYGIKLTKYIRGLFGVSGQLIYGGFGSNYRPEHSFETKLVEYNLQASLEVISLIFPRKSQNYGLEIYVGTGQFVFRTSLNTNIDSQQSPDKMSTGVPEFVYFFGGGLYFNVTDRIKITTDLSIRQAQNDNIDKYLAKGDFDYYSLVSFGVSWSFGKVVIPVKNKPKQKVNKGSPVWRNSQ